MKSPTEVGDLLYTNKASDMVYFCFVLYFVFI